MAWTRCRCVGMDRRRRTAGVKRGSDRLRPRRAGSGSAARRPSAGPWRRRRSGWRSRARRRSLAIGMLARRQRHGAGEQHLLAPLHERRAELAAEEARRGCARSRPASPAQAASVAWRDGVVDHRFAQAAQPLFLRQVDAQANRRGAAQLVEQERGEAALARQRLAGRRRRRVVGSRIELKRQGEQQARDFEDAALAPARRLGRRARPARTRRPGWSVERQQLGILDHRDRVLDAGRDPDRPRRRHDGSCRAATVTRTTPVDDIATCPQGWACGTTRVSARRRSSLARTGRCRSGRNRCGVSGAERRGRSPLHWRDLDRS